MRPKKIRAGLYLYRGYKIRNHGYYPPDKCIWWEAIDTTTQCADYHAHTLGQIIQMIDDDLDKPQQ